MKKIIFVVMAIMLTGCGQVGRIEANWTGYSEQCVDGVTYLQFASGATVKYHPDGTVWTCK